LNIAVSPVTIFFYFSECGCDTCELLHDPDLENNTFYIINYFYFWVSLLFQLLNLYSVGRTPWTGHQQFLCPYFHIQTSMTWTHDPAKASIGYFLAWFQSLWLPLMHSEIPLAPESSVTFKVCTQMRTEVFIFPSLIWINCNRISKGLLY
jgi:hypothetical protein